MPIRCDYDICPTPALARGKCELHFLMQYVTPLQKERRNIEDTLAILNSNIKEFVDELGIEKARARGIDKPERFLRHNGDGWTNTGMVFCHKCWHGFQSGIECMQHEEQCRASKPKKERSNSPRQPAQRVVLVDDDNLDGSI